MCLYGFVFSLSRTVTVQIILDWQALSQTATASDRLLRSVCVCVCACVCGHACASRLCVCSRRHSRACESKQCHHETVCKCVFVYEIYQSVCFDLEFGCVNARALSLCYSRTVAHRIPNCDGLIEYVCESVTFPVCHFL